MRVFVVVLVVSHLHPALGYLREKPPFLRTCYRADPQYMQCFTESIQDILHNMKNGFSHLGIPPLDPLHISELRILQGGRSPLSFDVSLVDVTVSGMSNAVVTMIDRNREYSYTMEARVANMAMEGGFTMKGRLLMIPFEGHGDVNIYVDDLLVLLDVSFTVSRREGHKFLKPKSVRLKLDAGNAKIKVGNLFNGASGLEDGTNAFVNENWRTFFDYVRTVLTQAIEEQIAEIMGRVLDFVPADYFVGDI